MTDPHANTPLTPDELFLVEEREALVQEGGNQDIDVICRDVTSGVFREFESKGGLK
jgi:hypothetical protein